MKIEDNFLEQKEFDRLQTLIMGFPFDWHYCQSITTYEIDKDNFQFVHTFYRYDSPRSSYFENLKPILEIINPISIYRIKTNSRTKTSKNEESSFHSDMDIMSEEKRKQWTTSIFYVNTNNGYTEFEDGTKIESVENRMVTFPTNLKHRGTSCTDEKIRVVINFNYFK